MYYEKEDGGALNFVAGLALGAILGASIALLTAPQPGKKTRRQIVRVVSNARESAGGELDDVAQRVRRAMKQRRRRQMRR